MQQAALMPSRNVWRIDFLWLPILRTLVENTEDITD